MEPNRSADQLYRLDLDDGMYLDASTLLVARVSGVVGSLRIWQLRHRPTRKGKSVRALAVEDQSLVDRAA